MPPTHRCRPLVDASVALTQLRWSPGVANIPHGRGNPPIETGTFSSLRTAGVEQEGVPEDSTAAVEANATTGAVRPSPDSVVGPWRTEPRRRVTARALARCWQGEQDRRCSALLRCSSVCPNASRSDALAAACGAPRAAPRRPARGPRARTGPRPVLRGQRQASSTASVILHCGALDPAATGAPRRRPRLVPAATRRVCTPPGEA